MSRSKGEMGIDKSKSPEDYLKEPYARILIPEADGGFSAEVLEFPGCLAVGESAEEAFRNLEEAAKSWIAVALGQGQEIPPPSANYGFAGKIALRLPRDLHRLAVRKAERDGVSLNQCLVTAIAAWVGADNLFERLAHRAVTTLVQPNFYGISGVTVTSAVTITNAALLQAPTAQFEVWASYPAAEPLEYAREGAKKLTWSPDVGGTYAAGYLIDAKPGAGVWR